ncbi:hypothetical protein GGR56DRAFT_671198 [Xylariaceae sp. FL0804]|nr:hypothetical protein GGR56DRAFT_671198 [Xylariaceae sp. FL0804]
MRAAFHLGFLVSYLAATACGLGLLDYVDELPNCALNCMTDTISVTTCDFTNTTCVCNDADFSDAAITCVSKMCTVMEQLNTAKLYDIACDKPRREQRGDIAPFLIFAFFTFAAAGVRLYVRYKTAAGWAMDDAVFVLMLLLFAPFAVIGQYVRIIAIGYDMWTLDPSTITSALKWFFIDEILYTAVQAVCRVGILLFLIRVFNCSANSFARVGYMVMTWVILTAVIIILMTAFQCWPVRYNWIGWKGDFGPHKCLNVHVLAFTAAAMGIAQDLVIVVLPLPLVYRLRMPLRKKLYTTVMFSLGALVTVVSCIRLRWMLTFATSRNPTYDNTRAVLWTEAEVFVMVIVVCLPSFRTLLALVFPEAFQRAETPAGTRSATAARRDVAYKNISYQSSGVDTRDGKSLRSVELRGKMATSSRSESRTGESVSAAPIQSPKQTSGGARGAWV